MLGMEINGKRNGMGKEEFVRRMEEKWLEGEANKEPIVAKKEPIVANKDPILAKKEPIVAKKEPADGQTQAPPFKEG